MAWCGGGRIEGDPDTILVIEPNGRHRLGLLAADAVRRARVAGDQARGAEVAIGAERGYRRVYNLESSH